MAKKLAIVVHGIGEQQPGETVDNLVGGLTGSGRCKIESETRMLRERDRDCDYKKGKSQRNFSLFPCHIRRLECGDDEYVFAEAFWADLSRSETGQVRGLIDLFKLVMGLGHIVRENAADIYGEVQALPRRAARLFVCLIHGPITTLNIALAVAFIQLLAFQALLKNVTLSPAVIFCVNRH